MKSVMPSVRTLFRRAAAAVVLAGAFAATALPLTAGARVMETGPTSLVFKQLAADGYRPFGAAVTAPQNGKAVALAIFKNDRDEWMLTSGNDITTKVLASGTNLEIRNWMRTLSVVDKPTAGGLPLQTCPALSLVQKAIPENSTLISGRMADGTSMQAYINQGRIVVYNVSGDELSAYACLTAQGQEFRMAGGP